MCVCFDRARQSCRLPNEGKGSRASVALTDHCGAPATALVRCISLSPTMAAYFFPSPIDVDIKLENEELRKQVEIKTDKEKTISCPVYYDGDSVGGQVLASPDLSVEAR